MRNLAKKIGGTVMAVSLIASMSTGARAGGLGDLIDGITTAACIGATVAGTTFLTVTTPQISDVTVNGKTNRTVNNSTSFFVVQLPCTKITVKSEIVRPLPLPPSGPRQYQKFSGTKTTWTTLFLNPLTVSFNNTMDYPDLVSVDVCTSYGTLYDPNI
jgi:hypothetical protein